MALLQPYLIGRFSNAIPGFIFHPDTICPPPRDRLSGVDGENRRKQDKLGLDVGAAREALGFIPCERAKPAGDLRSPKHYLNRIRSHLRSEA